MTPVHSDAEDFITKMKKEQIETPSNKNFKFLIKLTNSFMAIES